MRYEYHGRIGGFQLASGASVAVSRHGAMVVFESSETGTHGVDARTGGERARVHAIGFAEGNGADRSEAIRFADLATRAIAAPSRGYRG
jgi:hypothetical protein